LGGEKFIFVQKKREGALYRSKRKKQFGGRRGKHILVGKVVLLQKIAIKKEKKSSKKAGEGGKKGSQR